MHGVHNSVLIFGLVLGTPWQIENTDFEGLRRTWCGTVLIDFSAALDGFRERREAQGFAGGAYLQEELVAILVHLAIDGGLDAAQCRASAQVAHRCCESIHGWDATLLRAQFAGGGFAIG